MKNIKKKAAFIIRIKKVLEVKNFKYTILKFVTNITLLQCY